MLDLIELGVANSFKTIGGRTVFYPWGFGREFVIADRARRERIENGLRWYLILSIISYLHILFFAFFFTQPLLLVLALWPFVSFPLLLRHWTRGLTVADHRAPLRDSTIRQPAANQVRRRLYLAAAVLLGGILLLTDPAYFKPGLALIVVGSLGVAAMGFVLWRQR